MRNVLKKFFGTGAALLIVAGLAVSAKAQPDIQEPEVPTAEMLPIQLEYTATKVVAAEKGSLFRPIESHPVDDAGNFYVNYHRKMTSPDGKSVYLIYPAKYVGGKFLVAGDRSQELVSVSGDGRWKAGDQFPNVDQGKGIKTRPYLTGPDGKTKVLPAHLGEFKVVSVGNNGMVTLNKWEGYSPKVCFWDGGNAPTYPKALAGLEALATAGSRNGVYSIGTLAPRSTNEGTGVFILGVDGRLYTKRFLPGPRVYAYAVSNDARACGEYVGTTQRQGFTFKYGENLWNVSGIPSDVTEQNAIVGSLDYRAIYNSSQTGLVRLDEVVDWDLPSGESPKLLAATDTNRGGKHILTYSAAADNEFAYYLLKRIH